MCVCYILVQFAGYTRVYVVYSYVESNSVVHLSQNDTTSAVSPTGEEPTKRHMECGTAGEISMPPLKCGCFGSAA